MYLVGKRERKEEKLFDPWKVRTSFCSQSKSGLLISRLITVLQKLQREDSPPLLKKKKKT